LFDVKNKNSLLVLPLILALPLAGPSCQTNKKDGGFYKTTDGGENWQQIVAIEESKKEDLARADIDQILVDPNSADVLFAIVDGKGLFVSNQFGESWKRILSETTTIFNVTADSRQKGFILASILLNDRGKIVMSENGGVDWKEIYTETGKDTFVSHVRVDPFYPRSFLAVNSAGLLIRSSDEGITWQPTFPFQEEIKHIVFDPIKKDNIWALSEKGVWHSMDGGFSFDLLDLGGTYTSEMGSQFYWLDKIGDGLFLATEKGFYRSQDEGKVWQKIITLNNPTDFPPRLFQIIDAAGKSTWFLGAGMTLYLSQDEGVNWKPIQFEIDRQLNALAVKKDDPRQMVVGVKRVKENMLMQ
jgi:photosystem II stability/assembly factor-like uncharacterized protein